MNEPTWGWAVMSVDTGEIAVKPEYYQYPHTARRGLGDYLRKLVGTAYNPEDEIRYWVFKGDFDAAGGANFLAGLPKVQIAYSKL